MSTNDTACFDQEANNIPNEILGLEKALDCLHTSLDELFARLSNLLTPATDGGECTKPEESSPCSDMLSQIKVQRGRIDSMTVNISGIKSRLEL